MEERCIFLVYENEASLLHCSVLSTFFLSFFFSLELQLFALSPAAYNNSATRLLPFVLDTQPACSLNSAVGYLVIICFAGAESGTSYDSVFPFLNYVERLASPGKILSVLMQGVIGRCDKEKHGDR